MSTPHELWVRKQIEINTDPQRRCYNGCHFSSEMVWTDWEYLYSLPTREEAEESAVTYARINPGREYKVIQKDLK